jgi:ATP-binding protein involved in chromosome partitioning
MSLDALRAALSTVQDPDLHQDLVTLNMVRNLHIDGDAADFDLVLTTGACPVKQELEDACRRAALSVPGLARVTVRVSAEAPQFKAPNSLAGVSHVFGVGSGKGGVGKSTVCVNLAAALVQSGARVGILDADIYGPSIPTMLGISEQPQVKDGKMVPLERHGIKLMSIGFLIEERQAVVWRGPMIMGALKQFITDVAWGELDYLLVDLPPGTGDIQLTLAQSVHLAGAVVVSTPQAVALADVRRSVSMFEKVNVPILGVVENMSGYVCPKCSHYEPIFGEGGAQDEAELLGYAFLGRLPLEPGVRQCGDDGTPMVIARPDSVAANAMRDIAAAVVRKVAVASRDQTPRTAATAT